MKACSNPGPQKKQKACKFLKFKYPLVFQCLIYLLVHLPRAIMP
ncbi:hypothetical protein NEOC95_000676 [Neochlamydia sp. AcF95]|nr:hypothetical protein [Neochlamydia sp. AcF95]